MKPQTFLVATLLFFTTSLAAPQSYADLAGGRRGSHLVQRAEGDLPPGAFKTIMIKQLTAAIKDPKVISTLEAVPADVFDKLYGLEGAQLATAVKSLLSGQTPQGI
ncbi:hypothetical protein TWF569_006650 [Orbilia oligospora]|uniref:Uncharacterized protein n=1 Tax=Orbilia oligospora TaxID=2813651 RepID=A0A7C8JBU1_ORBOL|nr:hypothetical protein TWF102_005308 [Orbilia oligospora]KAF3101902.1 hypothetical protein TWF103_007884 [Orbilia oligospora]KAF3111674.1 hypothetical protein TWF706_011417 [Orbilia oligospora]KAF3133668.1 hypothetical protein TWF703_006725 [Orbilia oligospora]KAF3140026.1 hypothetical protein TWF594_006421 [Orbilia oligospora]